LFTLFGPFCAHLRTDAEFRRRRRRKSVAPPPAEFWSARFGAPARQPDLVRASRKTDGGAAEGSMTEFSAKFYTILYMQRPCRPGLLKLYWPSIRTIYSWHFE